jgi:hypothetical protein
MDRDDLPTDLGAQVRASVHIADSTTRRSTAD